MQLFNSMWDWIHFGLHDWQMKKKFAQTFRKVDPWEFEISEYEKRKYQEQISLLGDRRFERALEIGCAEGLFTEHLSEVAKQVVGLDIAELAVERARKRVRDLPGAQILEGSITSFPLKAGYDLMIASEVLYYLSEKNGNAQLDFVSRKLFDGLIPGGLLLMSNWFNPDEPSSVKVERGIKKSLVSAGFKERQELFKEGWKGETKHHYCLILLEKPAD